MKVRPTCCVLLGLQPQKELRRVERERICMEKVNGMDQLINLQNQYRGLGPIIASQFLREAPSHQRFPSRPILPHSASHSLCLRRFPLRQTQNNRKLLAGVLQRKAGVKIPRTYLKFQVSKAALSRAVSRRCMLCILSCSTVVALIIMRVVWVAVRAPVNMAKRNALRRPSKMS